MGADTSGNSKGRAKSKTRGSTRNADRLSAFAGREGAGLADWGACYPERLQAVVVGITAMGGAITFGLSRDLGAHSLTLLLDGNRKTLWFNKSADLNDELEGVEAVLLAMEDDE